MKKHNLHIIIIPTITMFWTYKIVPIIKDFEINFEVETPPYKGVAALDYKTYYEALDSALKESLELIKKAL